MLTNDTIKTMDSNILLSIVGMKLRDFYDTMDTMCEDLDLDRALIDKKLGEIAYQYDDSLNKYVFIDK